MRFMSGLPRAHEIQLHDTWLATHPYSAGQALKEGVNGSLPIRVLNFDYCPKGTVGWGGMAHPILFVSFGRLSRALSAAPIPPTDAGQVKEEHHKLCISLRVDQGSMRYRGSTESYRVA